MTRYSSTMTEALQEIREGFSSKQIKMAIGIASDKRYAGGNMTGAVQAIEKIKKGLADHPQVAAVLKRQNEDLEEGLDLDELKMDDPKLVKHFDKLKRGDTVKLKTSSTISKGKDFVDYVVKAKNTVNKGRVEKITLVTKGNEKAVKKFLYKRDGKVTFAIGDMGASIDDIKEKLGKNADAGDYIDDFRKSDAPQFKGKSEKERDKMAIAAYLDAKDKKEEVELDELKEPFVVVDTADGNKVVGTASSEKGAKEIITTAQLPPMKIKDKKTLLIVGPVKKKQMIGYPLKEETELDEGTWAIPDTPAQKRDLKKIMKSPLKLGKEGDNAADKMYSIIGDDELFDDFYTAGQKDPEGDARPLIKKAMKRLRIKEDRWFDRDSWRLDESTKPDHIKVFNSLKRGDKVEINYDSSIAGGTTKTFVIKTKNKVYKGKVDKVTMYPDGKTGGVKFHLYQYDNRPGVYMAIGDMGASLRDIKKL